MLYAGNASKVKNMLSEDRIKVMTKLAVSEKKHGKENEIASKYYKGDYISYHMIWTGIMATIAYGLGLLLYFGLNFERYMAKMHKMNLPEQGKVVVVLYIICLVAMLTVSYFVYRRKYAQAQNCLKEYCAQMRQLEKIYNNGRHKSHVRQKREEV